VVAEDQRRGARAALAAVDGDEVGRAAGLSIARELAPEVELADGRLDAHRQARGVGERSMKSSIVSTSWKAECDAGRDAVLPQGMSRILAISGVIFAAGKHAAEARLGALAELDLDGPHRARSHRLEEALHGEAPFSSRQPK
jgi:hypothetical protein